MNDTVMAMLAFFASAVVGLVLTPLLIPVLRRLKLGQQILIQDGPSWHKKKQGTPTMGGLVFVVSTLIAYLLFGFPFYTKGETAFGLFLPSVGLTVLIFSLLFACIGFADDMVKVTHKRNLGLTFWQKIILQLVLSIAYIFYLALRTGRSTTVLIPFFGVTWDLSLFYYLLAMILIIGFVNAVNLTDGIDGLCTSVTLPVSVFFAVVAALWALPDVSVLAASLAGACVAFLVYNWNPAKIMMGDVGSFFLGAMVVGLSFALDMPLIILVVGVVYLVEALSVMIQVAYFKITKGKRLFKMTPIHHSFELSGWSEKKICFLFGGVALAACVLALLWVFLYF